MNALSSFHAPEDNSVTRRARGQPGKVSKSAPTALVDFNIGMGGNDCGDMMRSRISCHKKSRKWWKGIFYYVIDQVLICCYKIWNEIAGKNKQMCMRRMVEEIIGCVAAEPSVYGNDGEITETVRETQPKKRRRLNEEGLSDTRLSGFYKHESSVQGKKAKLCFMLPQIQERSENEIFLLFV